MNPDTAKCHKCGETMHIDLLDAKDDGTGNYTILECRECYGPGWVPGPEFQGYFEPGRDDPDAITDTDHDYMEEE